MASNIVNNKNNMLDNDERFDFLHMNELDSFKIMRSDICTDFLKIIDYDKISLVEMIFQQNNQLRENDIEMIQISFGRYIEVLFREENKMEFLKEINYSDIREHKVVFQPPIKKKLRISITNVHPNEQAITVLEAMNKYINIEEASLSYQYLKGFNIKNGNINVDTHTLYEHIPQSIQIGQRFVRVRYRGQDKQNPFEWRKERDVYSNKNKFNEETRQTEQHQQQTIIRKPQTTENNINEKGTKSDNENEKNTQSNIRNMAETEKETNTKRTNSGNKMDELDDIEMEILKKRKPEDEENNRISDEAIEQITKKANFILTTFDKAVNNDSDDDDLSIQRRRLGELLDTLKKINYDLNVLHEWVPDKNNQVLFLANLFIYMDNNLQRLREASKINLSINLLESSRGLTKKKAHDFINNFLKENFNFVLMLNGKKYLTWELSPP